MSAYYNENDPKAAAWLRELIRAGLIAAGYVDERSIAEVRASELAGSRQCHFFAGIGGWSYALRLAGWPDDRPVWTGSCPCQPYSVGSVAHGGAQGQNDERHLWPTFFALIRERNPATVLGEQVSDAINWGWWDKAALDLESEAYACAAAILRGDTFGTDHQRRRLYWMAYARGARREGHQSLECLSLPAPPPLPVDGDPLARARRALAGDYSDLLPCDGLSVVLERDALKGYGNAIVPQVAAEFIQACEEAAGLIRGA